MFISLLPPFPIAAPLYRCFLFHLHSAGCSHHQPRQSAAPHTLEDPGPPSPTRTIRRPPPSACALANSARVEVAATDSRRGRRTVMGAAPAAGAAASRKGGRQRWMRRQGIGHQRRGPRHAAREATGRKISASDGTRGHGRGQRRRRRRRQQGVGSGQLRWRRPGAGAAPAAGSAAVRWVAASGGGGGQGRGRRPGAVAASVGGEALDYSTFGLCRLPTLPVHLNENGRAKVARAADQMPTTGSPLQERKKQV